MLGFFSLLRRIFKINKIKGEKNDNINSNNIHNVNTEVGEGCRSSAIDVNNAEIKKYNNTEIIESKHGEGIKEATNIENIFVDNYTKIELEKDYSSSGIDEEYLEIQDQTDTQIIELPKIEVESADIHIGIDLGTCYTKACWNLLDKDKKKIVVWNNSDQFFLPSKIWLDSMNNLLIFKPQNENAKEISYFKLGVLHNHLVDPVCPQDCKLISDPYRLYTAFYLARCLDRIEKDVLKTEKQYLEDKKINWTGNIGIPISYFRSEVECIFQEIISAAHAIQKHVKDIEPIKRIDELYQAALSNGIDKSFSVMPELYAEVNGFFSDFHTEEGYYAIFDVGGGTVDSAVVEFNRIKGSPTVRFLTSEVGFFGMEVIKNRINLTPEFRHDFMEQIAKTIVEAKKKIISSMEQL